MKPDGRKNPVRWTDQEWAKLVDEVALLRLDDPSPSISDLLMVAQKALPEDRRRAVVPAASLKVFSDRVRLAVASLSAVAAPKPVEAVSEPTPPPPTLDEVLRVAPMASLLSELFGRLLTSFDRLERRLEGIENNMRAPYLNGATHKPPVPVEEKRTTVGPPKALRVAVLGLLGEQMAELNERCKGMPVQLTFISKNISCPSFGAADHVLLFAKFIDHSLQNLAFSKMGREAVTIHHGGISGAVEAVRGICEGRPKVYRGCP